MDFPSEFHLKVKRLDQFNEVAWENRTENNSQSYRGKHGGSNIFLLGPPTHKAKWTQMH